MSAIVDFILLPRTALPDLLEMAKKPEYHNFLASAGKSVVDFRWSGWIFSTLLVYLSKEIGMRSRQFEFVSAAAELSNATGVLHEIFAIREKTEFLSKLNPDSFSKQKLQAYYNTFNETHESDSGEPMLAGIRALQEGLAQVNESNVLLLRVG